MKGTQEQKKRVNMAPNVNEPVAHTSKEEELHDEKQEMGEDQQYQGRETCLRSTRAKDARRRRSAARRSSAPEESWDGPMRQFSQSMQLSKRGLSFPMYGSPWAENQESVNLHCVVV